MTRRNERSRGGTDRTDKVPFRGGGMRPRFFMISGMNDKIKLHLNPKIVEIRCTLESFLLYTSCQRNGDDPPRNPEYLFIFHGRSRILRRAPAGGKGLHGWVWRRTSRDVLGGEILCTSGPFRDGASGPGHPHRCGPCTGMAGRCGRFDQPQRRTGRSIGLRYNTSSIDRNGY